MATSAAPTFFPLHTIGSERFVDGGMYANSPDEIAVHEAQHFLQMPIDEIEVLSIGATTAKFSFPGRLKSRMGIMDWFTNQRLISVMIAAQQMNTDFIMRHRLGDRYRRIDAYPSAAQASDMRLDNANESVISDLKGLADASLREHLPALRAVGYFSHEVAEQDFLSRPEIEKYFQQLRG